MRCYVRLRKPLKESKNVSRIITLNKIRHKKLINSNVLYEMEINDADVRREMYNSDDVIDFIIDRNRSVAL